MYSVIGVQREGLHLLQKRVLKLYEFVIVAWYVFQSHASNILRLYLYLQWSSLYTSIIVIYSLEDVSLCYHHFRAVCT